MPRFGDWRGDMMESSAASRLSLAQPKRSAMRQKKAPLWPQRGLFDVREGWLLVEFG